MTVVADLWSGRVGLAKVGWLYGLGGLLSLVTPLLIMEATKSPLLTSPIGLFLSLFLLTYAAFIAIAIWRSASNYGGSRTWRYLAKGSILFVLLQVVVGLA
ncbi:MAG: hypothetical protein AAF495_21440 [Pseudomonadota bacterium]